jgi:hypothetical protein
VSLFWVRVPVGAQHVYARQFLDRDQLAYDRLFLCHEARADRHGHRQNGRHRDGNRRNGQHERKLQQGQETTLTCQQAEI